MHRWLQFKLPILSVTASFCSFNDADPIGATDHLKHLQDRIHTVFTAAARGRMKQTHSERTHPTAVQLRQPDGEYQDQVHMEPFMLGALH